jgi:hypothetical protein
MGVRFIWMSLRLMCLTLIYLKVGLSWLDLRFIWLSPRLNILIYPKYVSKTVPEAIIYATRKVKFQMPICVQNLGALESTQPKGSIYFCNSFVHLDLKGEPGTHEIFWTKPPFLNYGLH